MKRISLEDAGVAAGGGSYTPPPSSSNRRSGTRRHRVISGRTAAATKSAVRDWRGLPADSFWYCFCKWSLLETYPRDGSDDGQRSARKIRDRGDPLGGREAQRRPDAVRPLPSARTDRGRPVGPRP